MRASEYPPELIRATLWRIVDMGRARDDRPVVIVSTLLTKDQLRHIFVAERLVDDYQAFRLHAGRKCPPLDDVRATLKRIAEHGKLPGVEIDYAEEIGSPVTKITVVEVCFEPEDFRHLEIASDIVDQKVIIMDGEAVVEKQKAIERKAKAKAAKDDKDKKSE